MTDGVRIRGGAGSEVAAAIVAAVTLLTEEEAARQAEPPRRPELSPWVTVQRATRIRRPRLGRTPTGYATPR